MFTLSWNEKCASIISFKIIYVPHWLLLAQICFFCLARGVHLHFVKETDILCQGPGELN